MDDDDDDVDDGEEAADDQVGEEDDQADEDQAADEDPGVGQASTCAEFSAVRAASRRMAADAMARCSTVKAISSCESRAKQSRQRPAAATSKSSICSEFVVHQRPSSR